MVQRRSATVKYVIAAFISVAFYCEYFVYIHQMLYWEKLKCDEQDPTCVKIFFIADPQIQGDDAVPAPLNYIFEFDSDRYLELTFRMAMNSFKPDVLVYLGDIMDEGSISTKKQFHQYVKRINTIFNVDYSVVQVWLPGDNDIGGENEPIRKEKIEEFGKVFNQPDVISFRNISFYKVNGITHQYPTEVAKNNDFKIVVSHYPITARHAFGEMVNKAIHPHIYFCAHDHESKYVVQNKQLLFRETTPFKYGDKMLDITFGTVKDKLYEIYVPTCSYRMGTNKMGYGVAILDKNGHRMRYTVYWSPQRFPYLILYLLCVTVLVSYICVFCTAKLCINNTKTKNGKTTNEEKVPFLDRI